MIIVSFLGLRSRHLMLQSLFYQLFVLLHTRTNPLHKEKPANWNTSHTSVQANPLLSLLEKCKSMSHLKQIQTQMTLTGLILDGFASSRLISFCALSESGNLDYRRKILFSLEKPNVFSWNVTIKGYSESKTPEEAIVLYKRILQHDWSKPDKYTYPLILKVCATLRLDVMSREILGHIFQFGFDSDMFVHNYLIHMFVSCGALEAARKMFDEGCVRDLVSWNSLINGYARSGLAVEALGVFWEMKAEEVVPDEVTMVGLVSSCAQLENLNCGREFHRLIERNGLNLTVRLANVLMDMYVKCGDLEAAQALFSKMTNKTVVSWTTMITGFAKYGYFDIALELLYEMPEKNAEPWNAMISGYVKAKRGKEALALFHEMQASNIKPDDMTMIICLSACSQLGALGFGMWVHHYVEKHFLSLNVALGTAIVDMYAKCGNITKAVQVFREMPQKNSLTWTTIIFGLADHGHAHDALSYFEKMIDTGLVPDEITFMGVLSACCHGGLVEDGRRYFSQMSSKFKLCANQKHFSCMVDLLGRAGLLEEAESLIKCMPIEADAVVWGALFFACRRHKNVLMGERAAFKLLELEPHDSGNYVLLARLYEEANLWEDAQKVWNIMMARRVKKTPGCSLIEANGVVCEFIAKDKLHPHSEQIYSCLLKLTRQMEVDDCVSDSLAWWEHFLNT